MSKRTFLIIDLANTFFRSRHAMRGDADMKLGMAFHITLNSIRKTWQKFNATHTVFCLEGRSWRKDYYPPYKRNRSEARAALTPSEAEEEALFYEAFDTFKTFIVEKTNCTVLQNPQLEADDLIAGWIRQHPSDDHIIISTDTDFLQLLAPNVKQYNGIAEHTISLDGYVDDYGDPVIDNKTKAPRTPPDPEWLLFEKCIRGDSTDNIFSAYPGVRTKSSSKKIGLLEAFADRADKGYSWNNLMLQRWTDHNGEEHRVLDDYERNRRLIDLNHQPDDIKQIIVDTIEQATSNPKSINQVGLRLMQFCALYDLRKIADQASAFADPLNKPYHLA